MYFNISLKKHENNISVSEEIVSIVSHKLKELLLANNSGNRNASQNPKWRRPGNLKAKIVDNRI